MAATLTSTFIQNFAKKVDKLLGQRSVFMAVRGTIAEEVLRKNKGRTYNYLTLTEGTVQDYTPYSDATIDDLTVAANTLTLNKRPMYAFQWDLYDHETHQAAGSILERQAQAAAKKIDRDIGGEMFVGAVTQTSVNTFDDGNIGGSAGTSITWNTTNLPAIFTEGRALVRTNSGESGDDFMIVTPSQLAKLEQSVLGNGFREADAALRRGIKPGGNGYIGNYLGVDLYECDIVPHSYVLTYTDQPSNSDTLTVGGVTVTAETTTSSAGSFDIADAVDDTYANLASLINAPGTSTGGNTTAFSAANQRTIRGYFAVQDTSANTVTLYSKWGSATITESLDNATLGSQNTNNILGKYEAIEEAHPFGVRSKVGDEPKSVVENFLTFTYSGTAVPSNNLERYIRMNTLT